jgi:hypothetical protein
MDPACLRDLWAEFPTAAPALALDAPAVVLDLDVKHALDGPAAFSQLTGADPLAFDTPIAKTPSGGLHLFFSCDTLLRSSVGRIAPGIDLRAPVSSVPLPSGSNARRWIRLPTVPLAALPAAIVEAAQRVATPMSPQAPASEFWGFITPTAMRAIKNAVQAIEAAPPGVQEVTLNNKAYALGGLVGAGELPFDLTRAALIEAGENMESGDPYRPWTQWQIEQKVDRALRQGMESPWLTTDGIQMMLARAAATVQKEQGNG